jgi:uncharacterized membrane protein
VDEDKQFFVVFSFAMLCIAGDVISTFIALGLSGVVEQNVIPLYLIRIFGLQFGLILSFLNEVCALILVTIVFSRARVYAVGVFTGALVFCVANNLRVILAVS